MKKVLIVSLLIAVFAPMTVHAASIGGALTQGQGKFNLGLDVDWVINRDLEMDTSDLVLSTQGMKDVDMDNHYFISGKGSFGLTDNLDIYLKLGIADFEVNSTIVSGTTNVAKLNYDAESAFAYGGGIKATWPIKDDITAGIDVQALKHDNDLVMKYTVPAGTAIASEGEASITSWHIAPFVARTTKDFTAYAGVKYSDSHVDLDIGSATTKLKAKDNFGLFLGGDFFINQNLALIVEVRLIDETALTLNGNYKF